MPQKENYKVFYALSFAWQLGFLIVVPLALMVVLGLWADNYFHSGPWLLLLGLAIGLITTVYEVYHLLFPLIQKAKHD